MGVNSCCFVANVPVHSKKIQCDIGLGNTVNNVSLALKKIRIENHELDGMAIDAKYIEIVKLQKQQ